MPMKPTILSACRTIELALGADGSPPTEFRVFPAGRWSTTKGEFLFDEKAQALVALEAKDYGNDFPVDYEHAMLGFFSVDPAESGKAAGWIPNAGLEVRNGELWAKGVTWTPDAAAKLKAREFRYLSPAFMADDEGRVTRFINIALTNLPATKGMDPLVMSGKTPAPAGAGSETPMKSVLIALGLAENIPEADALAHAAKVREVIALTGKTSPAEALGVVQAWKLGAESAATLSTELAGLKAQTAERELLSLVDGAVAGGKATPAQKDALLAMGRGNAATLKAFLEHAPVIVHQETKPPAAGAGPTSVSSEEEAVARQIGVDPKKLATTNPTFSAAK
jgi:phage I-like protein